MNRYLIELVGTFFLVFVVALSGNPLAVGGVLAAMIYMGGEISGGHFNPVVSLARLLQREMTVVEALKYMFFQILGGVLAASAFLLMAKTPFLPEGGSGLGLPLIVTSEILFTMALVAVILHTAPKGSMANNPYHPLAVGMIIMAGGFAVSPISGAIFNPAIGLGSLLVDVNSFTGDMTKLGNFLLSYLVAPVAGAILAVGLHRLTTGSAQR